MSLLQKFRDHFNEWQSQGHSDKPDWYDTYIDEQINELTNIELLEMLDMFFEDLQK